MKEAKRDKESERGSLGAEVINRRQAGNRRLYMKGVVTGAAAGLVVVAYRAALDRAAVLRTGIFRVASAAGAPAVVGLFLAFALCALVVGRMIHRVPMIRGSGIAQVKGFLLRQFKMEWLKELVLKFAGGVASMVCGLSLGRQGPSIQLGAFVGAGIASKSDQPGMDEKYLVTAGAGAGLAATFNAPLAGVLFSLEELHKSFSPVMLSCVMVSSLAAEIVSKYFFGLSTVFDFQIREFLPLRHYPVLVLLGLLCGLAGVLFNGALLRSLDLHDKWLKREILRPLPAFLAAGALGFLLPEVLGGGQELIVDSTLGKYGVPALLLLITVKLLFTSLSCGSGAPGGIFFPLLVIGAVLGRIFSDLLVGGFAFDPGFAVNFVILGMAAFFTAVTRAPITGAVLISEMTGSLSHLISLLVVSAAAYGVAEALKAKPIYEAFLDRMLSKGRVSRIKYEGRRKKIILTIPVCSGSFLEHRTLRGVAFPEGCVLIGVVRGKRESLPHPEMELRSGDMLSILTEESEAAALKPVLMRLGAADAPADGDAAG